ncbi:hypothetical protein K9N08_00160 [Candidatus Gracilibacteria bacterium]|nr:hypothetical protein [Candidatus Gracilibacteria bacterium]MCF7855963.1 hypothetical protein [Candidatus Gracilibacteria bacterium]MCF7896344.1 hypothetical protein [Candidatus Gracilibacteria bacterium]
MPTKKPDTFLKVTSGILAFGILVFGTLANDKNAGILSEMDASLNQASVITDDANTIPTISGNCKQNTNISVLSALQPPQSLFASVDNLDAILTGEASFDTKAMNYLTIAIAQNLVEAKILESGTKYEFVVRDGQVNFWKCMLQKNQLFSSITDASEDVEFLSNTQALENQIEKFGYSIDTVNEIENFLNFIKLPAGHRVLESTVLNSDGEIFFKIFETKLLDSFTYNDLRKDFRSRVGVTNLRPAVFGAESYYWMWGEGDKMAASVFTIGDRVFGISYQTAHFSHIRRVVDALREEFPLLLKKVELVKKQGGKFENLKITEFEQLTDEDLGSKLVNNLQQLNKANAILGKNLSSDLLNAEPIEIPTTAEETSGEVLPVSL